MKILALTCALCLLSAAGSAVAAAGGLSSEPFAKQQHASNKLLKALSIAEKAKSAKENSRWPVADKLQKIISREAPGLGKIYQKKLKSCMRQRGHIYIAGAIGDRQILTLGIRDHDGTRLVVYAIGNRPPVGPVNIKSIPFVLQQLFYCEPIANI